MADRKPARRPTAPGRSRRSGNAAPPIDAAGPGQPPVHPPLSEVLSAVARRLPGESLLCLCDLLEGHPPLVESSRIRAAFPDPDARDAVENLVRAWRERTPSIPAVALAWGLRAAGRTDEYHRCRQSIEVVWTGPTPRGTTLRRTDQALLDLIREARESLVIVFFAAYRIPAVRKALLAALDRGVALTLIAEPDESRRGKVSFDPVRALGKDLAERAAVYTWPPETRPRDAQGRYGSMHVKCAVADCNLLLVSSANITEFALGLNMELGLLVRGPGTAGVVAKHLEDLVHGGILRPS